MTPTELEEDRIRGEHLSGWLGILVSLAFATAPVMLGIQGLLWLKSGEWPQLSIAIALSWLGVDPLSLASTSWQGLNKAMAWFMEQHVFFALLAIAAVAGWIAGEVAYQVSRLERRSAA